MSRSIDAGISYTTDYSLYDVSTASGRSEIGRIPAPTFSSERLRDLSVDAKLFHFYDLSSQNLGPNEANAATATQSFCRLSF